MGITERRIRQKEEVRSAILESAWALVKEEGWQSLSIRKIADAIEYSVPVIYSHFENKDAILTEFNRDGFQLLSEALEAAKSAHEDPCNQLEAIAQAYWDFAFDNREYYQLMYGLGMPTCETVAKIPELQQFAHIVQSTLAAIIADSKHPDAEPFLKYHTFWSILHGLISINMMDNGGNMIQSTPKYHDCGPMVLKDAVAGFIKALKY
ncbi:TetR/AcrR family transcriptional regulator [Chitinophaga defluvii]|uniref:TetR/AcrR family transcriptional regulator n=1 Tax=Chitinophaga defluvii TaxID=3163343 RepID=A0ABV2T0I9_9BACT